MEHATQALSRAYMENLVLESEKFLNSLDKAVKMLSKAVEDKEKYLLGMEQQTFGMVLLKLVEIVRCRNGN